MSITVELEGPTGLSVLAAIGTQRPGPSRIEVLLSNGRCLRFDAALDVAALMQLIRAVERA